MIPKIIHYCWFGSGDLPDSVIKCIKSWKEYCPDYEIRRWDEKNFNVDLFKYTREAYENKKWAFVSDVARFWILYNCGGIYLDTDVELIRPIDDLVAAGNYFGRERDSNQKRLSDKGIEKYGINPGLGMASSKGNRIYKEVLEYYSGLSFVDVNGNLDKSTIIKHLSNVLKNEKINKLDDGLMKIDNITIYPAEYFSPKNYYTGKMTITEKTRSIHHYDSTWMDEKEIYNSKIYQKFKSKYGYNVGRILATLFIKFKNIR